MFLGLPKNTIKQYYGVARVEQQSFLAMALDGKNNNPGQFLKGFFEKSVSKLPDFEDYYFFELPNLVNRC
jgi:hypothetical protein